MSSRILLVAIGLAVTLLLGIATACGGDEDTGADAPSTAATDDEPAEAAGDGGGGGGELSLEEYFQEIDGIFERSDQEIDELVSELQTVPETATTEEQTQALMDFVDASVVVLADALDEIEALQEPKDVQVSHDAFLSALEDAIALTETFQADLRSANDDAELERLTTQFEEDSVSIEEEGDGACLDLQAIADDNGIAVDLNCED